MKRLAIPLGLLAWLALCCALAATLAGCDNGGQSRAGTSMGEAVYLAVEAAWYGRTDLPPIGARGDCERLPMLEVLVPKSREAYLDKCPDKSNACLRWVLLSGRVRSLSYPVAYINRTVSADRWPALVVHELLHSVVLCSGTAADGYDYGHADKRVWRPEPGSVEAVALRAIYEPADSAAFYDPGPLIDERE